jgi:hypothetical protein
VSKKFEVLANLSMSQAKQEGSYLFFKITPIFVRGGPLASLDPIPKSIFDFGSINGCQNSLHFSKKLCILISLEASEFILSA